MASLSTDSLSFPYAVQHKVFSILQSIAKACCFEFLKTWLPDLDSHKEFEVPEQLKLTQWTSIIEQHMHNIPNGAFLHGPGILLQRVLHQAYEIQDIAHQIYTASVKDMSRIVENTVQLTKLLKDENRSHLIEGIQKTLTTSTTRMMQHDQHLRARFVANLTRIAEKRRALDVTEKEIIAKFTISETENRQVIGNTVMESLSVSESSINNGWAEMAKSILKGSKPINEVRHSHMEIQQASAATGSSMKNHSDENEEINPPARLSGFSNAPYRNHSPYQERPGGKMPQTRANPNQKGPTVTAANGKVDLDGKMEVAPSIRISQPSYLPLHPRTRSTSGQAAPSNKAAPDRNSGPLIDL